MEGALEAASMGISEAAPRRHEGCGAERSDSDEPGRLTKQDCLVCGATSVVDV